ncbi:MAG: S1-like domain-containing RNA-binding protein [Gammaproteobacteria bacterium]|nr:S1-like domain-containing RNA-binding protein [Gammaproteobacteria bacterium]MCZ6722346.1 S1-like domain-containing RNA-binding protein [Gammaproteobacteria bacterium]
MIDIGQYNQLDVIKKVDFGLYLDGGAYGDILLPKKYVDKNTALGDRLEVFIYLDSEDRLVATTLKPKAVVGECAYLKVVDVNRIGAFLDWGLPKDLLVPFNQQQKPMQKGYSYTVYLYVDEHSERIAGSSRLEDYLTEEPDQLKPNQPVDLMIYGNSDLGFKAVVDGRYLGQLYRNEVFRALHYGEKLPGFIKRVRSDGKIDIALQPAAHLARNSLAETILAHMKDNNGISTLTDRSPPGDIYKTYGVSKATYKKALGLLYKNRQIIIEKHQLTLV